MPNEVITLAGCLLSAGVGSIATWWKCTQVDRVARRARDKRLKEVEDLYLRGLATDHRTRPYVRL